MKKRAISAMMAATMVWGAFSVPAMAATSAPNDFKEDPQTTSQHGSMSVTGTVETKEHKENMRILVPVDRKYIYEFTVDPEKNGWISDAVSEKTKADGTAYKPETVYFERKAGRKWCEVGLPEDDLIPLGGNRYVSNKSEYLVVSNIGSNDVVVDATVTAITPNDASELRVGFSAWGYAENSGKWVEIPSDEEIVEDEGVQTIIGKLSDEKNLEPNEIDKNSNIYVGGTWWEENVEIDEDGNEIVVRGDKFVTQNLTSTIATEDFDKISVRLVREGGHQIPEPTNAKHTTWEVEDKGTYYNDKLVTEGLKYNADLLDAVNSVAFQVQADASGKGWSSNQEARISVIWSVSSERVKIPTMLQTKVPFDHDDVKAVKVEADAGLGTLRAEGVKYVAYVYGRDNAEMVLDSSWCEVSGISNDKITITIKEAALNNLLASDAVPGELGKWLPAQFKVVFNLKDGGTAEGYFWIY